MRQRPFQILTAAIFFAVILPALVQDGMFMDGMLYTSVAHNLANGIGTFWEPFFSTSWEMSGVNTFHEHPPLVFGIQSIFFKIFGSSIYVERGYVLLTAIATAYMIHRIWKLIYVENLQLQKMSWLPILFWITIPVCFWSYQNNMQENTMGLFCSIAIYFGIQFCRADAMNWSQLLICGNFIFLSAFSKGVPGLFPLACVGIYWMTHFNFSIIKMIVSTLLLVLIPVIIIAIIYYSNESAASSLSFYFNSRLMGRVEAAPTVDSRFYIVGRLISELLGIIIITSLLGLFQQLKKPIIEHTIQWKDAFCFLLIGISAAIPLALTMVQKGFYMVPAFPYLAIGFSILIAPLIVDFISKINTKKVAFKSLNFISIVLLISVFIFTSTQFGKRKRDNDLLSDVYEIGKIIPTHSTIGTSQNIWNNWSLHTYLVRHYFISLEKQTSNHTFLLLKKANRPKEFSNYKKLKASLNQFDLFQKIE